MPRRRNAQNSFTSGVLDPILHERHDHPLYSAGVSRLDNLIVLPQGGVKRRPGTRFVTPAKNNTATRLIPFVYSATQGVMLEFGEFYIRFFENGGQLVTAPNTPLQITTPYTEAQVANLDYAQTGNTLVITHPRHAIRELVRISALVWQLRLFNATPPPTYESGIFVSGVTLTLGATTGPSVSITASGPTFLDADVDRALVQLPNFGSGTGTITAVNSATSATLHIVDAFTGTSLTPGEWRLAGSPVAQVHIDKGFPLDARATLTLQRKQDTATELVTNGGFGSGLTGWTDFSGGLLSSGTADAIGSTDLILNDTTTPATFISDGVLPGMRVLNTTAGTEDSVISVGGETTLNTSAGGSDWTGGGDNYEVRRTGTVTVVNGRAEFIGGPSGIAWIEQAITTVAGVTYRVEFSVSGQTLGMMVGNTSQGSELLAEFSYPVGNETEAFFTATGTTSYLGFRNNQNFIASLDNVSVKQFDIQGFRSTDTGRYVRMNEGIVQLTEFVNATQMRGIIRKTLTDTLDALPGAWSLEAPRWNDAEGYPHTVAFYGSRLFFGGTDSYPARFWYSRINVYKDFGSGTNATDGGEGEVASTEVNPIEWMMGERALLMGTSREEHVIQGSLGRTITPTDISAESPSKIGSSIIKPVRAQRAVLFVPRGTRRVRELTFEVVEGDRKNEDLSLRAEHLLIGGITGIAFQQEPHPILWVVVNHQRLVSVTYLQEHLVFGWAEHPTQGDVIDVGVIPHPDGDRDQVWIMVNRLGHTTPYVEYMDDGNGFYGQLMTDSTVIGTFDPPTTTISALGHLEDTAVTVLTDGFKHPDREVSNGEIPLQQASEQVEIGLSFTPQLTTLRPAFDKQSLTGLLISNVDITLSVLNTINAVVNGDRLTFTQSDGLMDTAPPLFTGLHSLASVGWDEAAQISIVQDMPYPFTLRSISYTVDVEEP